MVQVKCELDCLHREKEVCCFGGTIILEAEYADRTLVVCDEYESRVDAEEEEEE